MKMTKYAVFSTSAGDVSPSNPPVFSIEAFEYDTTVKSVVTDEDGEIISDSQNPTICQKDPSLSLFLITDSYEDASSKLALMEIYLNNLS